MQIHRFSSNAALQDYLLKADPRSLAVVPHQRLAHQVWHRQRRAELGCGRLAWEPLPLVTLRDWWADLFHSLWPPVGLASSLLRLALWRRALMAGPALPGTAPTWAWAQALDETYHLLCRHSLPTLKPAGTDSPLVAWRRQITRIFLDLLRQEQMITEGELPVFLLSALDQGQLTLPEKILLVGFPIPAPGEEAWLKAVARRTTVLQLQVKGDPQAVQEALVLPDRPQEMEWAAAQLLKFASREGLPLHRLAVTSPDLNHYAPFLTRVLAELLGPPQTAGRWAYNFSQGPTLEETPLFQAAVLPLKFITVGEGRADLISLLLSPYFGLFKPYQTELALWDRLFREHRLERGWGGFRGAVLQQRGPNGDAREILPRLHQVWETLRLARASGREWGRRLNSTWKGLGFPGDLDEAEKGAWGRLTALLQELEGTLAAQSLDLRELLEWLTLAARQVLLPGPGVQEAGIQIMGLLEMRGLDFSRVLCLGMNSGTFPEPPRPLPLLSPAEKRGVLGGTYQSQHHFAREVFDAFLGTAPQIVLTRPRVVDTEERVATPLYLGQWQRQEIAPLSRPHPAWLRAPAVQAALMAPKVGKPFEEAPAAIAISLPGELHLTQAQTALGCPCRFLLEVLLTIRELPEMEAGLNPRERGERLHQVLARFGWEYQKLLADLKGWDQLQARELLRATARQLLKDVLSDLHWQAEWERWLGEGESGPGLLWEWLRLEEERFSQGWRWQGLEVKFQDLRGPDWPFTLKGRIDRLDYRPETGELIIWDYKSGTIPGVKKVFDLKEEFQLPGYLLAVQQGRVKLEKKPASLRAGFISLKSTREQHLKHQDFEKQAARWEEVVAAWAEGMTRLARRLQAGDYRPGPTPAPHKKNRGACEYCPYPLICGFSPEPAVEENGEEE